MQRSLRALLFEPQESGGVDERIIAGANRRVVAAKLALFAHYPPQPPDCRMVEEQHLDETLYEVPEIIETTNVLQFVRQYRIELRRAQMGSR